MKYCGECGAEVEFRIPDGDNRPRYICISCELIHYQNPNIVAGSIPVWEDGRILLCRRAIEPRYGLWTLPAGFMENSETAADAAIRETEEEAQANIQIDDLCTVFSLPHVSQVYMIFRARLLDLNFAPGSESLETELFAEEDIPWGEIAFNAVNESLKCFFADRRKGVFSTHVGDIDKKSGEMREYRVSYLD